MFPNNSIYWMGKGMGGGGGGGGGMFRTAGRAAARARIASERNTESPNPSSSVCISPIAASGDDSNKPSFHLSATSPRRGGSAPVTPNSGIIWPDFDSSPGSPRYDESDWVSVIGSEDEKENGFIEDFVLGPPPPSMYEAPDDDEVHNAFSALQQVVDYPKFVSDKYSHNAGKDDTEDQNPSSATALIPRATSVGSGIDWMEPSLHLYTSRGLHPSPYGSNRVYDAFHLLQTDPCIQRMVISLSSDKAVWDAVMSNEAVRELRESYAGERARSEGSSDESRGAVNIVQWIFDNTRAKMMEVMEKISKIVNDLFRPSHSGEKMTTTAGGAMDPLEEKLRASFMLTVMVLLIVMVDRASKA